jgi:glycosyltransferase involved in cell wall biosynthesis
MIVKNGAAGLADCLRSVRGIVGQIVVVDTGSSDNSVEIARQWGAEVHETVWPDDFAAARNLSLSYMKTDWVLILDDDEELDAEAARQIPALLATTTASSFQMEQRNYALHKGTVYGFTSAEKPNDNPPPRAKEAQVYADIPQTRLFRNDPRFRYTGRVHELVDASIQQAGGIHQKSGFIIHHYGRITDTVEALRHKAEMYFELCKLKVKDDPESPAGWDTLGSEYMSRNRYEEAIACFETAIRRHSRATVTYSSLVKAYLCLNQPEKALQTLGYYRPNDDFASEYAEMQGVALYHLKRFAEARDAFLQCVGTTNDKSHIRSMLGMTELRLGMTAQGLQRLQNSLALEPENLECHESWYKGLLLAGRNAEAAEAASQMAGKFRSPQNYLRASALWTHIQNWPRAVDILRQGLAVFPCDASLSRAVAEICTQLEQLQGPPAPPPETPPETETHL